METALQAQADLIARRLAWVRSGIALFQDDDGAPPQKAAAKPAPAPVVKPHTNNAYKANHLFKPQPDSVATRLLDFLGKQSEALEPAEIATRMLNAGLIEDYAKGKENIHS